MATTRSRRPPARRPETIPCRIEWAGPEESRVVLDEDGISFHTKSNHPWAVEECDLDQLLKVIAAAKIAKRLGHAHTPVRPTREEMRDLSYHQQSKAIARVAIKAIRDDVDPPAIQF